MKNAIESSIIPYLLIEKPISQYTDFDITYPFEKQEDLLVSVSYKDSDSQRKTINLSADQYQILQRDPQNNDSWFVRIQSSFWSDEWFDGDNTVTVFISRNTEIFSQFTASVGSGPFPTLSFEETIDRLTMAIQDTASQVKSFVQNYYTKDEIDNIIQNTINRITSDYQAADDIVKIWVGDNFYTKINADGKFVNKSDIVDNLNSLDASRPLSANMGRELYQMILNFRSPIRVIYTTEDTVEDFIANDPIAPTIQNGYYIVIDWDGPRPKTYVFEDNVGSWQNPANYLLIETSLTMHNQLQGRDATDCHDMGSITGLVSALAGKSPVNHSHIELRGTGYNPASGISQIQAIIGPTTYDSGSTYHGSFVINDTKNDNTRRSIKFTTDPLHPFELPNFTDSDREIWLESYRQYLGMTSGADLLPLNNNWTGKNKYNDTVSYFTDIPVVNSPQNWLGFKIEDLGPSSYKSYKLSHIFQKGGTPSAGQLYRAGFELGTIPIFNSSGNTGGLPSLLFTGGKKHSSNLNSQYDTDFNAFVSAEKIFLSRFYYNDPAQPRVSSSIMFGYSGNNPLFSITNDWKSEIVTRLGVISADTSNTFNALQTFRGGVSFGSSASSVGFSSNGIFSADSTPLSSMKLTLGIKDLEDAIPLIGDSIEELEQTVGGSVRYDTAQTLTSGQKSTARSNTESAWQGDLTALNEDFEQLSELVQELDQTTLPKYKSAWEDYIALAPEERSIATRTKDIDVIDSFPQF